jgi:hypothetical protein
MLAGLIGADDAMERLATLVRAGGGDDLADRLDHPWPTASSWSRSPSTSGALMLSALEDPPEELAELRAALLANSQWRLSEGLD